MFNRACSNYPTLRETSEYATCDTLVKWFPSNPVGCVIRGQEMIEGIQSEG
jgi:hypothetical protein